MKKFDFDTIENFDDHILKSIPNYDVLMETILSISQYFISRGEAIYDLGCSTGKLLRALECPNRKVGYDNAALLPDGDPNICFTPQDLNNGCVIDNACLVYSIFTLQFLNRNARQRLCKEVYMGLNKGGAFILCEKIYQEEGLLQEILSFTHYDYKTKHFTPEEIIMKERDLRYIMKPNTLAQNMELLRNAGFNSIAPFWQSYNFVGLIAIK